MPCTVLRYLKDSMDNEKDPEQADAFPDTGKSMRMVYSES